MTRSPKSDAASNGPNAKDELCKLSCELERELAEARAEKHMLSQNLADAQADIAEEIKHAAACKEQWDAWQATAYRHEQRISELAEARAQVSALRDRLYQQIANTAGVVGWSDELRSVKTVLADTAACARRHDAEVAKQALREAADDLGARLITTTNLFEVCDELRRIADEKQKEKP